MQWHLVPGEPLTQRIIDHPAITFSIEHGDVPAPYVVSAARAKAWTRTIAGLGEVFALRLRPAGLAVLSDLAPASLPPEQELTAQLDARAHRLLATIAAEANPDCRARCADELVRQLLEERPLTRCQRLANDAVDALTATPGVRTGKLSPKSCM